MGSTIAKKFMGNLYPNEKEIYVRMKTNIDNDVFSIARFELRVLLETIERLNRQVDICSYPAG